MKDIMLIYNNCEEIGVKNRTITEGREIELVRNYIDYRKNQFQASDNNKMAIFIEPQVGNAYPDIVFVEYDPEKYQAWNSCRNTLEKKDLKILYHIFSVNGIDFEEVVSQLGVTWKDAGLSIEKLYDSNLIIREGGKWVLRNKDSIVVNNIQAVEAKVDKWEQVLQQSIINKNFASESYALMDTKTRPKKEILTKFGRFGVGVCLKNGNEFKMLKKAKQNNIPHSFNSILFNEWIGRIMYKGDGLVSVNG